jgi:hypothetical protein
MIKKRYRRGASTIQRGESVAEKVPLVAISREEAFPKRELTDAEVADAWAQHPGLEFQDFFNGRKRLH